MSPARARTRTARSGVERTNHEATVPPTNDMFTDYFWEAIVQNYLHINEEKYELNKKSLENYPEFDDESFPLFKVC